jgi:hypothetical protein
MNPTLSPHLNLELYLISVEVVQYQEQDCGGSMNVKIVIDKPGHVISSGDPPQTIPCRTNAIEAATGITQFCTLHALALLAI